MNHQRTAETLWAIGGAGPLRGTVPRPVACALLLAVRLSACLPGQQEHPDPSGVYFPAQRWRTATPESQGLDSRVLSSLVKRALEEHLGVHSLLVIRHGYVVMDAYFYPYNDRTVHDLASVTKSVTSLLTGIAVNQGLLKLDQTVMPLFPDERPSDATKQKESITIRNLLEMESGLDCGYAPGEQELEQMKRSPDWVRFALSLPMKYDPGKHAAYCSPGYHLLGSAIGAAAHSSELEYGRNVLFEPLGIRDVVWADDPQGRSHGWGDSHFYPGDLAKIGYLYLHGGRWGGKQIVPEDWVKMSTTPPTADRSSHGGMGYEWGGTNGKNGLQYGGSGRGGQTVVVWPGLDMIVVSMAGGNNGQIAQAVPDAVKSRLSLPEDAKAGAELGALIATVAGAPPAEKAVPLPAIAAEVSGSVYQFPVNPSRIDQIGLTFRGGTQAQARVQYLGQELTFPVGLDGVYRLGPNGPLGLLAGAKGKWTSPNEFLLDLNFVANINHYTLQLRFEGEQVFATMNEASGLIRGKVIVGTRESLLRRPAPRR